jgi:hypothetical protein
MAWGLAAMRRDGWHGIVDFTTACRRRPGAGARGGVRVAEENFMIRSLTQAEARNDRSPNGDGK